MTVDLPGLLPSWELHLRAERKSPETVKSYGDGVRRFLAWADGEGRPAVLDRASVNAFVADLLEAGAEPATVRARQLALRRFSAWLREDGDMFTGTATVRRGKGGRGRVVPFGPQTSRALDRYVRARRGHRLADTPALWLGDRGKAFSYDALHKTLGERARVAEIKGFRPHRLRHTAAYRWHAAGGSEGGLMAVAGWTQPDMLLRYTRVQASARAAAEARALGLGDF